jgi:uridine kinase
MSQGTKPVTIGITGGSASGETTFAKALSEELSPFSSVILHQDSYFRNWGRYPAEVREKIVTANHPGAVCWGGLIEHIQQHRASNMPILSLTSRMGIL